jgi:hypothetical protein
MSAAPADFQVAAHEGHHAAGLLLQGLPPERVEIVGDDRLAGSVSIDWGEGGATHGKARRVLLAIICGGRCEGAAGWDSWPLDPNKVPPAARRSTRSRARGARDA